MRARLLFREEPHLKKTSTRKRRPKPPEMADDVIGFINEASFLCNDEEDDDFILLGPSIEELAKELPNEKESEQDEK